MADFIDKIFKPSASGEKMKNVAEMLDDHRLQQIGSHCIEMYNVDKSSRLEWDRVTDDALKLAMMQNDGSREVQVISDTYNPMIARAVIQFTANTFSEVIRDDKIVKSVILGNDPDGQKERRQARVSSYLNYQMLIKDSSWQDNFERTLNLLATIGTVFRKIYYDPCDDKFCFEICNKDEVYVNNKVKSLEHAKRITYIKTVSRNKIIEWERAGWYLPMEYIDESTPVDLQDDSSTSHKLLEQLCYLDLDEDGYGEPYIVTVVEGTSQVLNILPAFTKEDVKRTSSGKIKKITLNQMFVDYHFLPSFDGSFYGVGYGALLLTITKSLNSMQNQLADAGYLANTATGFISGSLAIKSGDIAVKPGKFITLQSFDENLAQSIQMLKFPEPSVVLLQLMQQLEATGKELSSVTDIMTGNELVQNVSPNVTMAMIEKATKVYSGIQRRILRALSKEVEILYKLNQTYPNTMEYLKVVDNDPEADMINDFDDAEIDIKLVADPIISTNVQRAAQSDILMGLYGRREVNNNALLEKVLKNAAYMHDYEIQQVLIPPDQQAPDPGAVAAQAEAQLKQQNIELRANTKQQEINLKVHKEQFNQQLEAAKMQLAQQQQVIDQLKAKLQAEVKVHGIQSKERLGVYQANINKEIAQDDDEGSTDTD